MAARLCGAGWNGARRAKLTALLERAVEYGLLTGPECRTFRDLARLRNSHAHFRAPAKETFLLNRVVHENTLATEVIAEDATRAIAAVAGFVRRQSDMRLGLGPRDE